MSSTSARAMDFYSCEGKVVRRDQEVCFGWWLSDLTAATPTPLLEVRVEPAAAPSPQLELRVESATDSENDSEVESLLADDDNSSAFQSLSLVQRLSPSTEKMASLVDRRSPTHRPLEAVLNVGGRQPGEREDEAEPLRPVGWRPHARHGANWSTSPRRRELGRSSDEMEAALRTLQGKLKTVEDNHRQMILDIDSINRELQAAIVTTSRLTTAARSLVDEMQDVRYLDELISMMEGHLDRISLRIWPFTTAHVTLGPDTCEEYNLVV